MHRVPKELNDRHDLQMTSLKHLQPQDVPLSNRFVIQIGVIVFFLFHTVLISVNVNVVETYQMTGRAVLATCSKMRRSQDRGNCLGHTTTCQDKK